MKTLKIIISTIAIMLSVSLVGQNIELTFTGDNNGQPVTLDSVLIRNVSQGSEVTLYPPDLTLILVLTGTQNEFGNKSNSFNLQQNYPNPFGDKTSIQLNMPGTGLVKFLISNLLGQSLHCSQKKLSQGIHTFSFTPGKEKCYFLTTSYNGQSTTIKMLCNHQKESQSLSLNYYEKMDFNPILKSLQLLGELPFELGDKLLMIGYSESGESGMLKSPEMSQEYIMQFATNVPCPGLDSLLYDDQWYHTIQIFGQCWIKENMNVGTQINANQPQANNQIIEKYCLGNDEYYCSMLGGLYTWNEMMQFTNQTGGQGICPPTGGWHIPSDLDWQILEGATDSQYKIDNPAWGNNGWRGSDAGGNLKQTGTSLWEPPNSGATDAFGFKALPAGYIVQNGFWGAGYKTYFWSSKYPQKYFRNMDYNQKFVRRGPGDYQTAFSVRCVKD